MRRPVGAGGSCLWDRLAWPRSVFFRTYTIAGERSMPQAKDDASFYQLVYQLAGEPSKSRRRTTRPSPSPLPTYADGGARTSKAGRPSVVTSPPCGFAIFPNRAFPTSRPSRRSATPLSSCWANRPSPRTLPPSSATARRLARRPNRGIIVGCRFTGRIELDVSPAATPTLSVPPTESASAYSDACEIARPLKRTLRHSLSGKQRRYALYR